MIAKKRRQRKLFDRNRRTSRAVIFGYPTKVKSGATWEKLKIDVLARKDKLQKVKKGRDFLKERTGKPKSETVKIGGKKFGLGDQYLKTGEINIILEDYTIPKIREALKGKKNEFDIKADNKTKILYVKDFYPKSELTYSRSRPSKPFHLSHNIKQKGIGTASVKRIRELAQVLAKKGEKVYVCAKTSSEEAQEAFEKSESGFKNVKTEGEPGNEFRYYVLKIKK